MHFCFIQLPIYIQKRQKNAFKRLGTQQTKCLHCLQKFHFFVAAILQ